MVMLWRLPAWSRSPRKTRALISAAANAAVQMAQDTNKAQVQGNGSSMNVLVDAQRKATFLLAGRVIVSDTTLPGTFNSLVQMNFTYR